MNPASWKSRSIKPKLPPPPPYLLLGLLIFWIFCCCCHAQRCGLTGWGSARKKDNMDQQQAQIWAQLSPYQQFQLLQQQSLLSQGSRCINVVFIFISVAAGAYYDDLSPEDTEWFTEPAPPDPPDTAVTEYQRVAHTALDSWKLYQNEKEMKRINSRLSQSGRGLGETSDLKGLIDTKSKTNAPQVT